ncbi:MAG: hypothetical protein Q7U16_14255 [Agitococcus sp.]|nr:hypothetical protein [Agitococcus sp.]
MLFYAVNSSWIAPTVISPTSDKVLPLTAQMLAQQQNVEKAQTEVQKTNRDIEFLYKKVAVLRDLSGMVGVLNKEEQSALQAESTQISGLIKTKQQNDASMTTLLQKVSSLKQSVADELAAGLLTGPAAQQQLTAIQQSVSAATDGRMSTLLAQEKYRALDGKAKIEMLAKTVEVTHQLADAQLTLETAIAQKAHLEKGIEDSKRLAQKIESSPYYKITQSTQRLNYAFVPYDNSKVAVVGASVYGCLVHVLFCKKVGTVLATYTDEQLLRHPLFRYDVRGTLIELSMTDTNAAKDKVLFVGGRPVLF